MSDNRYAIRRALVLALYRFYCPQDLNTLMCDDAVICLDADPERLKHEFSELTLAGYLCEVPGYPEYRSLSPALRQKLDRGGSLMTDPFFAGPAALGARK